MSPDEFVRRVIDKPWVNRAEGPAAYDCWGLVIASFRDIDGVTLPSIEGYIKSDCATHYAIGDEADKDWWENSSGLEGDVAAYYDHKGRFLHVGRVFKGKYDELGILHSSGVDGVGGVKWEPKASVSARFHRTEYKRYAPDKAL